jgi:uncharacterized protein (DUF433 family)
MSKRHWFEVLAPKQMLHWVSAGRSGAQYHDAFPDLTVEKVNLPKRFTKKRAKRNAMAKASRRANR